MGLLAIIEYLITKHLFVLTGDDYGQDYWN
jgi:hypothetical protein